MDLAHNGWCPRLSIGGLEGSIPFRSAKMVQLNEVGLPTEKGD